MRVLHLGLFMLVPAAACGKLSTDASSAKSATSTGTATSTSTGGKPSVLPAGDSADADCELAPSQTNVEPPRTAMTCTWKSDCTEGGVVQVGGSVDPASIKVTGQTDAKDYTGTYDATSGELRFAQWACPAKGSSFVVQFQQTDAGGDAELSNPYADCKGMVLESYPVQVRIQCTWKKACEETVHLPLGSNEPGSATVEMSREDSKTPSRQVPVDASENAVVLTADLCPEVGAVVNFSYTGKATQPDDGGLTLYAHPCGNGDPVGRSCPAGEDSIDVKGEVATCSSLDLGLGDPCTADLEKCEHIAAQACSGAPTTVIASPTYYFCRSESFPESTVCPESRRAVKRDIEYLSDAERARLAGEVKDLRLARYRYLPDASTETGPQLGFIIDDEPDLAFLTSDKGHVNLYGYVSALVALVQEQQQRIEALEKQLEDEGGLDGKEKSRRGQKAAAGR
jgi:hypothetical protein